MKQSMFWTGGPGQRVPRLQTWVRVRAPRPQVAEQDPQAVHMDHSPHGGASSQPPSSTSRSPPSPTSVLHGSSKMGRRQTGAGAGRRGVAGAVANADALAPGAAAGRAHRPGAPEGPVAAFVLGARGAGLLLHLLPGSCTCSLAGLTRADAASLSPTCQGPAMHEWTYTGISD